MRRRRKDMLGIPGRLLDFDQRDWPGDTWRERFDAWRDGMRNHAKVHGWAGGELDMLMRAVMVRQRHEGRRLHRGVSDLRAATGKVGSPLARTPYGRGPPGKGFPLPSGHPRIDPRTSTPTASDHDNRPALETRAS